MKTNIKMLEIKGFKTPNFAEPKGEAYQRAMSDIVRKVEEKRKIKNDSITTVKKYKDEITRLTHKIVMAEDEFEELELKTRRKKLQEELESIEDYSGLDVNEYAKKLINKPELQKLRDAAQKEYLSIVEVASTYEKELKKRYEEAIKELTRFKADTGADSNFRMANVRYNTYKNN